MTVLPLGTLLYERFRIRSVISEGPLGNIYLVLDVKISERTLVAREFLPLPAGPQERLAAQKTFQQSIEIVRTFRHPNLIQVWESFVDADRIYLITEYVEGLSLEALAKITPELISEEEVLELGIQACDALEYLHGLAPPFFMKDLSPRTLVVDRDKKLKIGAYGLHLIFTPAQEIPHSFLAPEFRRTGEGSKAADVYSLAATFYFLLTRRLPENPIQPAHLLNPKVSEQTSRLLQECLRPDPAQRQNDISEMRKSLYDTLHPPDFIPPPQPRRTIATYLGDASKKLSHGLAVLLYWGVELARRPYYFFLVALVLWAAYLAHLARPHQAFKKTGPLVYIACAEEITVVDPVSFQVLSHIPSSGSKPVTFLLANEKIIWLASRGGTIRGFRVDSNEMNGNFSVGQAVGAIAASRPGSLLASLDKDNTLAVLAESTGKILSVTPVGEKPGDLAYDAMGNKVFLLAAGNTLEIVEPVKRRVTDTLTFDSPVSHLTESPDGKYIYLSFDKQNQLQVFDPIQKIRITSIELQFPGPYRMAALKDALLVTAHDGNRILLYEPGSWVKRAELPLDKPRDAIPSPDGKKIFATNDAGYLYDIDSTSGNIQNHATVGKDPSFILYVP